MKHASGYENNAPHFLGAFFEGPINGRKIRGIREFGEDDEYGGYVRDAATVLGFFSDYEQYGMVRHAYVEYLNLLERQAAALANHVHLSEVMRVQVMHNINRRLRSFLSEFRIFLDYTETQLKRRYGADSEQVSAFKAAFSHQFDDSFDYRFVYKLRNYALHVNLPLNAMSLASGEGEFDAENPDTHNRFAVKVDRDALLRGFDWGKHVKPGLEGLPPSFELNPILKEAMYCLEKIHVELVCFKLAEEKKAAERIVALASQVPEPAIPCVLRLGGPEEDIINGYTLHMKRVEGTEGCGPDRIPHLAWNLPACVCSKAGRTHGALASDCDCVLGGQRKCPGDCRGIRWGYAEARAGPFLLLGGQPLLVPGLDADGRPGARNGLRD